jgi:endonuclease/exonuclease/phosphatase family metal-dependent hydrolase
VSQASHSRGSQQLIRTIVLGDFNDDTNSPPYNLFVRRFIDACDAAGGFYEKTWPSAFPVTRIDFAFVSRALKLKIRRCRATRSRASDHLPVLVDLKWPPAE